MQNETAVLLDFILYIAVLVGGIGLFALFQYWFVYTYKAKSPLIKRFQRFIAIC